MFILQANYKNVIAHLSAEKKLENIKKGTHKTAGCPKNNFEKKGHMMMMKTGLWCEEYTCLAVTPC
jgi:hypothetical protein